MLLGFGIILLVLAIAAIVWVVVGLPDTPTIQIDGFLFDLEVTPLQLFIIGAIALAVLVLAGALTRVGARRYRARQKELKNLRQIAGTHGDDRRPREESGKSGRARADDSEKTAPRRRDDADTSRRPDRVVTGDTAPPPEGTPPTAPRSESDRPYGQTSWPPPESTNRD